MKRSKAIKGMWESHVKIPCHLLDLPGNVTLQVCNSLELTNKHNHLFVLRNLMAEVSHQITLLEQWRDHGTIYPGRGEIDQQSSELLETYKFIYGCIMASKSLRSGLRKVYRCFIFLICLAWLQMNS